MVFAIVVVADSTIALVCAVVVVVILAQVVGKT